MDKDKAGQVVDQLVAWNVPASLVPLGLYTAAVRVRLAGGREAVWDADGAAGLEAQVLRDGMLVGYVAELPDSAAQPAGHLAWLIGTAEYGLSPRRRPDLARPAVSAVVGPGAAPAPRPRRRGPGLLRSVSAVTRSLR